MLNIKINKNTVGKAVLLVLTALYILFIWLHSSMNSEISANQSKGVLYFLTTLLNNFGVSLDITEHLIRKSAHFLEFALLGFIVLLNAVVINGKIIKNLLQCGFICLITALIDEFIQLYVPGRSAQVTDVVLDFFGAVFGILFFVICYHIFNNIIKRKRG